jgi:hypothetical protein
MAGHAGPGCQEGETPQQLGESRTGKLADNATKDIDKMPTPGNQLPSREALQDGKICFLLFLLPC